MLVHNVCGAAKKAQLPTEGKESKCLGGYQETEIILMFH